MVAARLYGRLATSLLASGASPARSRRSASPATTRTPWSGAARGPPAAPAPAPGSATGAPLRRSARTSHRAERQAERAGGGRGGGLGHPLDVHAVDGGDRLGGHRHPLWAVGAAAEGMRREVGAVGLQHH